MKRLIACLLFAAFGLPATTHAATVLTVDLNTVNQITISATPGASSATVSGSDFIGVYLDQMFGGGGFLGSTLVGGNLTNANNPADNTPLLYRGSFNDPGLNIYSFSTAANVNFTAGTQAFTGSATWLLDPNSYTNLLAGSTTGSIFFAADTFDDLAGATVIGEWSIAPLAPVPLPATAALLGAALFGFSIYGRRQKKRQIGAVAP